MTAIAFRDGIMAADSAIWSGETLRGHCDKIVRREDGCLIAAAGAHAECQRFREWALACEDIHWQGFEIDDEDFGGLIAEPEGDVFHVDGHGNVSTVKADFYAEGCAGDMAFYAMLAGASAAEAVALCIAHHAFAGGIVQIESLYPARAEAA